MKSGAPEDSVCRPSPGRWLKWLPMFLLLGGLVYIFLFGEKPKAEIGPRTDFYLYFLPLSELGFQMMAKGILPLWNPFIFCGMPLISSIELGFFYPPNWVHLLLPAHAGFNLLTVFHIFLASGATFFYCHNRKMSIGACLLASMCYGFSGALALHLWAGHMSIVYSMAWFPVIMLCIDKVLEKPTLIRFLALAWGLALQFLAGFPMFTLAVGLIMLAYLPTFGTDPAIVWRKGRIGRFLLLLFGSGLIYLLLICVQLIPTLEFIQHSHRGILDYQTATTASFPVQNLVTFVFPKFFGDGITVPYRGEFFIWEGMGYCGVAALIFSLLALLDYRNRFVIFWGFVSILTIGIGLGKYSWIYEIAYLTVPGLNLFRGVGKFIFFAIFSIAVLAGHGLDRMLDPKWEPSANKLRYVEIGIVGIGALGIAVCLTGILFSGRPGAIYDAFRRVTETLLLQFFDFPPPLTVSFFKFLMGGLLTGSLTCFLVGLSLIRFRFVKWGTVKVLPLIILSIMALELYHHNFQYFQNSKALPIETLNTEAAGKLFGDRSLWRISALVSSMEFLNRFVHQRIYDVGGYENTILTRYDAFLKRLFGVESSWWNIHLKVPYNDAVYDMLNVKYVIYEPRGVEDKKDNGRSRTGREVVEYRIRKRNQTLGRAFISHRTLCVDDFQEALHHLPELISPDPEIDGLVESGKVLTTEAVSEIERSKEHVKIVSYTPNEMILHVHMVKPGFLIVGDIFYPGWKAWVDKEAVPVFAANVCLRAVHLETGKHRVRFAFQPESFFWGAIASMIGILLTFVSAVSAVIGFRRKKSQATETSF